MSFGEQLRGLQGASGLSQPELARRAGVPVSTLRNWEADRGFSRLADCMRLARALGVPVERFGPVRRRGRPTSALGPGGCSAATGRHRRCPSRSRSCNGRRRSTG